MKGDHKVDPKLTRDPTISTGQTQGSRWALSTELKVQEDPRVHLHYSTGLITRVRQEKGQAIGAHPVEERPKGWLTAQWMTGTRRKEMESRLSHNQENLVALQTVMRNIHAARG